MRTLLALGALSLLCATPVYGQTSITEPDARWSEARACVALQERAACWRVVADSWPPLPQTPVSDPPREPSAPPAFMSGIIRAGDAFSNTIGSAADKLAAGVPAVEALQGLKDLPVEDPPFVPNPLSDISLAFGRLDAYALLSSVAQERQWQEAEAAILAAWEADLPADSSAVLTNGAVDLAASLARRGDGDAVERVLLTMEPEDAPEAVTALIGHGRLEAAAAVAGRMTVEAREGGLRREAAAMAQRYRTRTLPFMRAAMMEEMDPELVDQTLSMDEDAALEALAEQDWPGIARDEVTDARSSLLRAAGQAGRPDLATPLALTLWEEPVRQGWTGANTLIVAVQYLVTPGAPEGAVRLVEAERRLRVRDRKLFPLKVLYDSWIRLGRQDQADALLDRWRTFAAHQRSGETSTIGADLAAILIERDEVAAAERLPAFYPLMLLQHDVMSGVGAARLEERIAGRDPDTQRSMLADCGSAIDRGALDAAEACVRRRMAFPSMTPLEQWSIAGTLLSLGTKHARSGDRSRGEALIAEGLAFSPGPPERLLASDIVLDTALESVTAPQTDRDAAH